MARGSWFMAHGSWLMVHGSLFMAHGHDLAMNKMLVFSTDARSVECDVWMKVILHPSSKTTHTVTSDMTFEDLLIS